MGQTYEEIKTECVRKGVSLRELTARAGVSLKTVERWKKADPLSIEVYRKLTATLSEIEATPPADA